MANAYFLVLASLQTIPEITNTFGVPTILLPLSVVVIVDAVFAVLEVRAVVNVVAFFTIISFRLVYAVQLNKTNLRRMAVHAFVSRFWIVLVFAPAESEKSRTLDSLGIFWASIQLSAPFGHRSHSVGFF